MRKLIVAAFISLDGVIQAPGGPDEDSRDGFCFGGWIVPYADRISVRQLLAAGLVDELRLMIFPVLLGRGKRLFGDDAQPSAFTLENSTGTPGGVLITRYIRSGEVRTGTFEQPAR